MKKTAVVPAIVVIGAVAWMGAAWYTGQGVERSIRQHVEQINEQPTFGTVAIESYERGVFSSRVRYTVNARNLPLSLGLLQPGDQLTLLSTVQHGPFPGARLARGEFAPVLASTHSILENSGKATAWFAAAGAAQPVQERSTIHYDGHIDFNVDFAELSVTQPELELASSAATLQGRAAGDLSQLNFTGELETLRVRSSLARTSAAEPDRLALQGISFTADYRLGQFDVYLGEGRANIQKLSLEAIDEDGRPLNVMLGDYSVTSLLSEDATHVSGSLDYGLGSVLLDQLDLGSVRAILRFGHLDGQAVKGIVARYRELQHDLLTELAEHEQGDELPPMLDEFLDASLEALLPGNPVFGLDPLRWTLGGSESSLRLNAALQQPADPDDPLQMVRSLDAALVISQPMGVELFKRLAQISGPGESADAQQAEMAAKLSFGLFRQLALASGYMMAEADNLVARLSYADGQVRLNGRQRTLGDLLDDLPGSF